jgi:hypothetical protein
VATSQLGLFGFDGKAQATPLPLVTRSTLQLSVPSVARAHDTVLLAAGYLACASEDLYCEPRSLVILHLTPSAALGKAASIPIADPAKMAAAATLVGDGGDHTWLTWWEQDIPQDGGPFLAGEHALLAVPLATDGTPAGPVERWFVGSTTTTSGVRAPSIGPMGLVYPVVETLTDDAGTRRIVHLLHRQLDGGEPVEDVAIETGGSEGAFAVDQIASPRVLVLGSSVRPAAGSHDYGALRRLVCREDN